MANKAELRQRLERLLAGGRNTRDLDALFLHVRQGRAFGHGCVEDVGNFVGHAVEREKGLAWGALKSISATMTLLYRAAILPPGTGDALDKETLLVGLAGALDRDRPFEAKRALGVSKREASAALKSLAGKIAAVKGKDVILSEDLTRLEQRVFKRYTTTLDARAAFDDVTLIKELRQVLMRNKLLDPGDLRIHNIKDFVAVYAVERMHLSELSFDGNKGHLTAGYDLVSGETVLTISGSFPIPSPKLGFISVTLFLTSCRALDWCEPELLEPLSLHHRWPTPIEVGPTGKLRFLN